MKCWKCDMELADGTSTCIYCGAAQKRKPAVTETGKAMRILYDRYGAQEVLKNSAYLVNGLGDLTDDSKKLRNQIKMGMDAGLGRLYLEQLNLGAPDESFDTSIKLLLTEEAGLNEKTANEIAGYFDEMIGWISASNARPKASPIHMEHTTIKEAGRDSEQGKTCGETPRNPPFSFKTGTDIGQAPLPNISVPEKHNYIKSILFGIALEVLPGILVELIFGKDPSAIIMILVTFAYLAGAIWVIINLIGLIANQWRSRLSIKRSGNDVICSWKEKSNIKWYLAVNNKWAAADVRSPVTLKDVPSGANITLAYEQTTIDGKPRTKILFEDCTIAN